MRSWPTATSRPSAADAVRSKVGRKRFVGITNSATTSSTTTAPPTARLIRTVRADLESITFPPEHMSKAPPSHSPRRKSSGSPARTWSEHCDIARQQSRCDRITHIRAVIGTSYLSNGLEQQENRWPPASRGRVSAHFSPFLRVARAAPLHGAGRLGITRRDQSPRTTANCRRLRDNCLVTSPMR